MKELNATIEVPAGDIMESFDRMKLATFFNVGTIEVENDSKVQTIILGPRKNKGKHIDVNNLALFTFERDSMPINFILSYGNEFSAEELEYETFMVEYNEIRESIESWFKLQCGLGHCRNFKWSSEYKSYLQLYDKKMKN
ncbi:hypothetical protein N9L92_00025 [Saprospiraceae bacterium]|nr:hypothetical protein [Saprospiraceae bacterium]